MLDFGVVCDDYYQQEGFSMIRGRLLFATAIAGPSLAFANIAHAQPIVIDLYFGSGAEVYIDIDLNSLLPRGKYTSIEVYVDIVHNVFGRAYVPEEEEIDPDLLPIEVEFGTLISGGIFASVVFEFYDWNNYLTRTAYLDLGEYAEFEETADYSFSFSYSHVKIDPSGSFGNYSIRGESGPFGGFSIYDETYVSSFGQARIVGILPTTTSIGALLAGLALLALRKARRQR